MADEIYRQFSGEIRELKAKNEFLTDVTLTLLNNVETRNKWTFTNMNGNKNQFAGKPLLIAYEMGGNKIGAGHNSTKKVDANGREYLSFTGATDQRIIGSMSDNPDDIWVETDENGVEWIKGKGTIWNWYAKEAAEKIKNDTEAGNPMSISIEALIEEYHMDGDVEIEDRYMILGTTILGDGVRPAVAGANIRALQEGSGFEELKLRAASYIESQGDNEEPVEESKIKPQKNNSEKEKKALKAFSKKQLAQLSAKFDGYSVVAAGQDDNGIHVCLMSADGATAVYTMENLDATVAPEKIMRNNAQVSFEFGEDVVTVDCCDLTDRLAGSLIESNTKVNSLTADLESARNEIKELNEREAKRRIKAAKAMAESTLNQYNAFREEKVEKEVLNSINEAIDRGDYSNCVDAEGCWVGEEAVADAVLAKCAKSQMELDRVAAQRKNGVMVWDAIGNDEAPTGLSALLSEF